MFEWRRKLKKLCVADSIKRAENQNNGLGCGGGYGGCCSLIYPEVPGACCTNWPQKAMWISTDKVSGCKANAAYE